MTQGGTTLRRGEASPAKRVDELGSVPLARGRGATAAVEGFADALVWSLASDSAARDPRFVPQALGGQLNVADAAMLVGFDRTNGVEVDVRAGAYRVLGYAGEKDNPTQVMVEVVVPIEVGGVTQRLVAGGVVTRTDKGWIPTSLRPREMKRTPDAMDRSELVTDLEAGELGLGWETFAEAGK